MSVFSSRCLQFGVGLLLLGGLLASTDWRAFGGHLRAAEPGPVALVVIGYTLGQVLSAYKWRLLARAVGFEPSLRACVSYYFGGMYLNLFAPSTLAGDAGRGLLLAGGREGAGRALRSVLADRVSGLVMLVWVSALGCAALFPPGLPAGVCSGVIAAAAGTVLVWWLLPGLLTRRLPPGHLIRRAGEKLFEPYRSRPGLVLGACGLALGFHVFQIGLLVLLADALSISVPLSYLLVCVPLITMLSSAPLSVGGLGVREGGYVFFLSRVGVGQNEALALSLGWTAVVFAVGLIGGLALCVSLDTRTRLRQLGSLITPRRTTGGSGSSLRGRPRPRSS